MPMWYFLTMAILTTYTLNVINLTDIIEVKKKNHTQTSESVKEKISQSCQILCEPTDYTGRDILQARILERVASSLLQGIFPTERSNPSLLHSWWILYQLSHQTSPRILESVAYPFPRGSSQPRNRTGASYLAGRFFTS